MDGIADHAWLAMAVHPGRTAGLSAGICRADIPFARRPTAGALAEPKQGRRSPRACAPKFQDREQDLISALRGTPGFWCLPSLGFGSGSALYATSLWLPQIVKAMGFLESRDGRRGGADLHGHHGDDHRMGLFQRPARRAIPPCRVRMADCGGGFCGRSDAEQ